MKIWMKNKVMIEKHNQEFKKVRKALYYICYNIIYNIEGLHTSTMGLNEFSDLSKKEWNVMAGSRPGPVEREKGSKLVMSKEAPVVTQKNQDYIYCTGTGYCPPPPAPPPPSGWRG